MKRINVVGELIKMVLDALTDGTDSMRQRTLGSKCYSSQQKYCKLPHFYFIVA